MFDLATVQSLDWFNLVRLVAISWLVLDILYRKNDPHVCMGWLLGAVLVPEPTLILYLLVLIVPRGLKRRELIRDSRPDFDNQEIVQQSTESIDTDFAKQSRCIDLFRWVGRRGFLAQQSKSISISPFFNSDDVYRDLHEQISKAKHCIFVQFYQIQSDDVGFAFLDKLAERIQAGVKVYVLFDALGSFSMKTSHINAYRKRGLEIHRFFEVHPIKRRFQLNCRNHRKLVLIDGHTAYIGGFNIGRQYLQGPDREKPRWVDFLYRVESEEVLSTLINHFAHDWFEATKRPLGFNIASLPSAVPVPSMNATETIFFGILRSAPYGFGPNFYNALVQSIYLAHSKVYIMTPYFVPDSSLLRALKLAVERGVKIEMILSEVSNHELTDMCSASFFAEMFEAGISVSLYPHGVCHGKVVVVDDILVLSGSSNLDFRSFFLNFETDFLTMNASLACSMSQFLDSVRSKSRPLSYADIDRKKFFRELSRRVMRLFAPLM